MDVDRKVSLIAVVISAACFGTLAILTPLAYEQGADKLPLLAWRFVIAALLLGAVATIRDRRALAIPASDLFRYSALALTGYGAASVCFFYALGYADASVVAVLLYAYPAFVTIAGWLFLGDSPSWARAAAVAVTFLGCALVSGVVSVDVQQAAPWVSARFGGAGSTAWQGIALGLGAALGYTLFNLLSHRWLPGRSRLTMMTYTFGLAAILPAVGAIASGGVAALDPSGWTPAVWWLLIAIVLVPTFAAIVLYLEGIRGLGPSQAAIVSTLEPVVTVVLAFLILDEKLGALQYIGVAFVLAGVVLAEILARRASVEALDAETA